MVGGSSRWPGSAQGARVREERTRQADEAGYGRQVERREPPEQGVVRRLAGRNDRPHEDLGRALDDAGTARCRRDELDHEDNDLCLEDLPERGALDAHEPHDEAGDQRSRDDEDESGLSASEYPRLAEIMEH